MRRLAPLAAHSRLAFLALVASLLAAGCSRRAAPAPVDPPSSATTSPPEGAPGEAPASGVYRGRVIAAPMSYAGADWLDRAERAETEQPDAVIDALHVAPGSTVADIGAGTGFFTVRLARRVGPSGRVIATDLQPEMLAILRRHVRDAGLGNVTAVVCTERDAKLPEASLDLALMVDVYHELARPAETLAEVRRALKKDGRLALVEYRGEDPAVAIKAEHKMTLAQVRAEVEGVAVESDGGGAFRFVASLELLRDQRVIVFAPR
jgi:ubiquinone/menaquinone biosynthesis C-methylase UbiE